METIIEMVVLRSTVASRLASPLHLPHTHSHLPVSLDTTLLRSNLLPFAIYSIVSLSTTLSLIPMPDSYTITPSKLCLHGIKQTQECRVLVLPTP